MATLFVQHRSDPEPTIVARGSRYGIAEQARALAVKFVQEGAVVQGNAAAFSVFVRPDRVSTQCWMEFSDDMLADTPCPPFCIAPKDAPVDLDRRKAAQEDKK